MSIGSQWVRFFDLLSIYLIQISPTVLHPRHKLQYFEKAGWEDSWIKTSREIVRTEFDQTYAFMDVEEHSDAPPAPSVHFFLFIPILDADLFILQRTSSTNNIFDDLPALSAPSKSDLRDELDTYLSTDPEHVTDPIAWWSKKRSVYPRLHRMALDYLTIPGEFIYLF
jgi:hypothetical protein